jgi:hypothetical protein
MKKKIRELVAFLECVMSREVMIMCNSVRAATKISSKVCPPTPNHHQADSKDQGYRTDFI